MRSGVEYAAERGGVGGMRSGVVCAAVCPGYDHQSDLVWAEVRLDHLQHNLRVIRDRLPSDVKFMAVVKAGGYGHGLVAVAVAAVAAGADALAVSTYAEGVALRQAEITQPILILSPIQPEYADAAAELDLELTVFQASWLAEASRLRTSQKPLRVHIKLDTGMGRYGLRERSEFEEMMPYLRAEDIEVVGVYTHFATANQADETYVREQFRTFQHMRMWVEEAGFGDVVAHCANSAAAIRYPELALDMVRVGAALYGILPVDREVVEDLEDVKLMPTLSIRTKIRHVKKVAAGRSVSYDRSYRPAADEWIATLPIGYADGWFRGYSGCQVLIGGQRFPIVGNICMNQTMIRIPSEMPIGTQVTLLGVDGEASVTLDELAEHIGSIPQQVLVMLSERLPRVYRWS